MISILEQSTEYVNVRFWGSNHRLKIPSTSQSDQVLFVEVTEPRVQPSLRSRLTPKILFKGDKRPLDVLVGFENQVVHYQLDPSLGYAEPFNFYPLENALAAQVFSFEKVSPSKVPLMKKKRFVPVGVVVEPRGIVSFSLRDGKMQGGVAANTQLGGEIIRSTISPSTEGPVVTATVVNSGQYSLHVLRLNEQFQFEIISSSPILVHQGVTF